MDEIIIDVREKDEFRCEHVSGSINLPLSTFNHDAPALLGKFGDRKIIIMCLSGNRARMAHDNIKVMKHLNLENFEIFPRGIKGWKEEGKEVISLTKKPISIMRQVQIAAGSLIVLGGILGTQLNPNFWYLSGFVGLGLTFAGVTGTCAMAGLLKLMPWNNA